MIPYNTEQEIDLAVQGLEHASMLAKISKLIGDQESLDRTQCLLGYFQRIVGKLLIKYYPVPSLNQMDAMGSPYPYQGMLSREQYLRSIRIANISDSEFNHVIS